MAVINMTPTTETNKTKGDVVYEYSAPVVTGEGNIIMIPDDGGSVESWLVALIIDLAGAGTVQTTISSRADVQNGNANWIDWDNGAVTATAAATFWNVTAVRVVMASGAAVLEVRAS